jgi:hypothetical protein
VVGAFIFYFYWRNFLAMSATALKFFSDVGDRTQKYKKAIFKPNHQNFEFFDLVPKSPTHTGLICVKTPMISQRFDCLTRVTSSIPDRVPESRSMLGSQFCCSMLFLLMASAHVFFNN